MAVSLGVSDPGLVSLLLFISPVVAVTLLCALGRVDRSQTVSSRAIGLTATLVAGLAATWLATDPAFDGGHSLLGGALVVDHTAGWIDLVVIASTACVLSLCERPPSDACALLGCVGAMCVAHAGDLITVYIGIELATMAMLALTQVTANGRSGVVARTSFVVSAGQSAVLILGVVLLYGALSSTELGGMASRVSAVFSQWGAVQKYVGGLESEAQLPSGLVKQFEGKIITGMAPAALFIPGMLLCLAGLVAKAGLWPHQALGRGGGEQAGATVALFRATVVRTAALAAVLRLFVATLNGTRLVFEPYGWASGLAFVVVVAMIVAHVAAWGSRQALSLFGWVAATQTGVVLLVLTEGARRFGRPWPDRAEVAVPHAEGDSLVALALLYFTAQVIAMWGLYALASAASRHWPRPHVRDLAGLLRGDRLAAVSAAICVCAAVGIPPLLGGTVLARLWEVLDHGATWSWLPAVLVIHWLFVAAILGRVLWVWFSRRRVAASGVGTAERRILILAALLSVGLGIGSARVVNVARVATAGLALPPANTIRAERTRAARSFGASTRGP